ncbi:MAG: TIGR03546 family protein [Bdellovibrionaceae bacterium]|nr:TIGR03546 family protein [Pseudobdellovibrionaceae bacterium]
MTLLLKQIFGFLKLLNSDTGTNQLASGIMVGFILGMTPSFSLQTLLVFVLLFLFRIQIGAAFLAAFFFKFMAYLLDPTFHSIGSLALEVDGLKGLYTTLYNLPIIPFTRFNNSIVMGSAILSIILAPIIFILAKTLIQKYREKVLKKFQESKFWKVVKATGFYKWYAKYDSLYG